MTEIFKAWQCIGCGRIDGPQQCVGICQDRKAEFVYASDLAAAEARAQAAEARLRTLESFVRRIGFSTPRDGQWERSYRSIQREAQQLNASAGLIAAD
jgi:hypothetical protein